MPTLTMDFRLPDVLANWPWPRAMSNLYSQIKEESSSWVENYSPFDQQGLYGFMLCDFTLLASLTFASCNRDVIRLGTDLMNFYYIFTDYVSRTNNAEEATKLQQLVIDALRNPTKPRPAGEACLGAMAKDFMMRAARITQLEGPTLQHFIQECDLYTAALVNDITINRPRRAIANMSEYLAARRPLCGARPMFAVLEIGLELPPEVLSHPVVKGLTDNAVDLICMINDMNSYPLARSQASEADNVIAVIMSQYGLDLQTSYDYLELDIKKLVSNHLSLLGRLPSWNGTDLDRRGAGSSVAGGGDLDKRVSLYLGGLGQWVRGNDDWCFESGKFFGPDSMNVKSSRWVRFSSQREGLGRGPRRSMGLNSG